MGIEVFNRYEYKYQISQEMADKLIKTYKEKLNFDEYCERNGYYQIVNRYVDTVDNQLIRKSITKPIYKHKLRIRNYTKDVGADDFVYFEIKKKFKGLVNKRRCKMKYKEALYLIEHKELPEINDYINVQILKEIIYILEDGEYEIKNLISYNRIAFFDNRKNLRISFDFDVKSETNQLLDQKMALMEVKTATAMPIWLAELLNENKIYKQSYSKYGIDYIKQLKEQK